MIELPKVSVIVPVFNAGERLAPSIDSLLKQTLKNLEIIIVNDASTDNSKNVIDRLANEYSSIVPVHLTVNKGVHEARLAGLKKASAPWIGFLDADDFARPNMFYELAFAAINNNVDIVICGSDRVSEDRKLVSSKIKFRQSKKIENNIFDKFCAFEFGTGMLWNKLYKREIIEPYFDLHFSWRQNINEDLILNIGCFLKANSVYLMSNVLHEYLLNKSSVTSVTNNIDAYVNTYRAYALSIDCFSEYGSDILVKITEMYRTQISWGDYLISDVSDIMPHEEKLKEAVDLIYRFNPSALALLSARSLSLVSGRLAVKSLLYRCLSMMRLS